MSPQSSTLASPTDAATGAPHGSESPAQLVVKVARRFGTVIALGLLIVYFSATTSGAFMTVATANAILTQVSVVGILALGLTVCLIVGEFDLSIGWTASLAGMVATGLMSKNGTPVVVALAVAVGIGIAVGLINGLIVTLLKVNALLATLATGSILSGIINWYSISPFSEGLSPLFLKLGQSKPLGIPMPAYFFFGIAIVLWVLLQQTATGRRIYALGGNAEAARIAGVHTTRLRILAFIISGTCAAVAGLLLAAQLGSGQPTGAVGLLLSAFAGAFLGSATWREGEFHIGGTVIGIFIMGVTFAGLALLDAEYFFRDVITGLILIIAVGSSSLLRARS